MRIGILGTGTIATAVVRGIAGDGHQITVSERSVTNAAALARDFANVTIAANAEVVEQSDVVFLGLMAEAAPAVLTGLPYRAGQEVISFMAGAPLDAVAGMVAPSRAAALMLPFPAIAQGGSAILTLGDAGLVEAIFGARNTVFALKDAAEMDAYICAQAVLSPVARMVDDAARWLGARIEDGGRGEAFLRSLVASGLAGGPAADLIAALNTPGGYNQRLRRHMEASGMSAALAEGLTRLETGE